MPPSVGSIATRWTAELISSHNARSRFSRSILRVTDGAAVSPDATYVYMSNHQSHLDIPILYASLPSPTIRMLAKTELFPGRATRRRRVGVMAATVT